MGSFDLDPMGHLFPPMLVDFLTTIAALLHGEKYLLR
jgi:hypothetical protein